MLDEDWYCRLRQLEPAQRVLAPVLTILRGEQNAFSHSLGQKRTFRPSNRVP
jgi:hypothetical protein